MAKHFLLCVLLLVFSCTMAMEHGKFEKCDQKGFCKRMRSLTADGADLLKSNYAVSSTKFTDTCALLLLKNENTANQKKNIVHDDLVLKVELLPKGVFRLRVRDIPNDAQVQDASQIDALWSTEEPRRRSAKDVLLQDRVTPLPLVAQQDDQEKLVLGSRAFPDSTLVITKKAPFTITWNYKNEAALILNKNNLLAVESVKTRANPPAPIVDETNNSTLSYEGETALSFDVIFPKSKHLFGIPERPSDFILKPTRGGSASSEPYRMYNLDVFRYELNNPLGLYGAIPLLQSVSPSVSCAIFSMNPSETFVDVLDTGSSGFLGFGGSSTGNAAHWIHETGILDLFIFTGPTPKDVLAQYTYFTGVSPIPQRFSLGHHQCRWNYKDEADVQQVDSNFDVHNIPYDVLWLDIEHTDDKKYFTWDAHYFPDPHRMITSIAAKGRKMVTISDPHIKRHTGYYVHDAATSKGYYVKNANGDADYEGHCWPGSSSWLDYFNPEVREFYAGLFNFDTYKGSSKSLYTWIDMNEPSVFSGPEVTMHKDAKHFGNVEHREVHNQYGFYQAIATFQGHLQRANREDRPFILTRSFFAGSQRYVAVWTGDNEAKWDHLDKAQPMLMTLGMSGLPYVGADVGGFFDNPETELLVRWYQAGAFYPFFRAHAHIETQRREPWLFGDENTALIRAAIMRRYKLIPYYYTLSYTHATTGSPLMRPLLFEYPKQTALYDIQDQFLIGKDLLIKPVVRKSEQSIKVILPEGEKWYGWEDASGPYVSSQEFNTPMDFIPVLQRGGSILPMQYRLRRSSTQMLNDPFTLQVALADNSKAFGELYLDDGSSFNYEKGAYVLRQFAFDKNVLSCSKGNTSLSAVQPVDGAFNVQNTVERVIVLGYPSKPNKIVAQYKNQAAQAEITPVKMLDFEYDGKKLIIRNPQLNVAQDWTISIE